MLLHHFIDRAGSLGKLERTPQGGARAPANLARAGIMPYLAGELRRQGVALGPEWQDSDTLKIYLPPEVLQAAADTLGDAPVTNEHPPRFVTTATHKQYACGHVARETITFDGVHLKGQLVVQDAGLLTDIEVGTRRGVSLGYKAATVFDAGVTPDGEAYDAIRVRLEYNHAAVVKSPRGGETVCLALDSDLIPTEKDPIVTVKLKIKGAEHSVETAQTAVDSLEGSLAALTAEVDSLRTKLAEAEGALKVAQAPETIAKHVQDATDAKAAAEAKASKLEAVKKAYPTVDVANATDAFIDGMFATIKAKPGVDELRATPAAPPVQTAQDSLVRPVAPARARMLAELRTMHQATDNSPE
jgi:hypothetical protein